MKRTLLATIFLLSTLFAFAQNSPDGSEGHATHPQETRLQQPTISIFPNPATNYISINKDDNVKSIAVYNLVGRKLKSFQDIQKDEHYDVSNLPNGMYLIRVTNTSNKVITTQRISKR